jgi:hypothetical protein
LWPECNVRTFHAGMPREVAHYWLGTTVPLFGSINLPAYSDHRRPQRSQYRRPPRPLQLVRRSLHRQALVDTRIK